MAHLEILMIIVSYTLFDYNVERQLGYASIMTPITYPNLRMFIEVLIRRVTAHRLEKLGLDYFKYHTVSIPSLLQFMDALEYDSAKF